MIYKTAEAWSTRDEMKAIEFMVSDKPRGEHKRFLTREQKITRLQGWLDTFKKREPSKNVDYDQCKRLARELMRELVK